MTWQMHPKFATGQFRNVAEELLEGKAPARKRYVASLIGALSFLGRMEEADSLYSLAAKNAVDASAARFFLAIGWTRRSEYERSRALVEENKRRAQRRGAVSPIERFFAHQGQAFLHFYTGRVAASLEEASLSRAAALEAGNAYARCLATDSLGHCKVRLGEIHAGLSHLAEAEALARKNGNAGTAAAIGIARELYSFEFGLAETPPDRLEQLLLHSDAQNNYSQSNVALELARQLTLRGEYARAAIVLEKVAPAVYASQNRRQEILLNLRLAELAGRRGEFFQSRHFLWFSRRLLHREVDSSLELMALGVERKLALAEGKVAEAKNLDARWLELGGEFASVRDQNLRAREGLSDAPNENPEDRVHQTLRLAARGATVTERLTPLLQRGYLAEAALQLRLRPGARAIAILPAPLGLLVHAPEGVEWRPTGLSSLQTKLLRTLGRSGRETSKEELVQNAWGYEYSPLRHDPMVYAALSGLRKALGSGGAWLQASEAGYRLDSTFWQEEESTRAPSAAPSGTLPLALADPLLPVLNHRQLQILEWLAETRYVSVPECQKRFGNSEVTALRDLAGLWKHGVVIRLGKARATRYALAPKGKDS